MSDIYKKMEAKKNFEEDNIQFLELPMVPAADHSSQVIIRVFSDFCDSAVCKKKFEETLSFSPLYGPGKRFLFTTGDDYTHAIILNKATPNLKPLPKQNVLGLACEPLHFLKLSKQFVEYAKQWIGRYYIGELGSLPEPFIEHHGFLWHSAPRFPVYQKNKVMSIILSDKKITPNHRYRHKLVSHIAKQQLPIDVYGRGAHSYNFNRVKGAFEDESLPYQDYHYTIVIENFCTPHYISEKLTSPLMYNCKPLYYGCHNVFSYFENIIVLSGNARNDLNIIKQVLSNPAAYYEYTATPKNKKSACLLEHLNTIW